MMETTRLGKLTLVTPPSILEDNKNSFCIINFKTEDQDKFANYLNRHLANDDVVVYVVDSAKDTELTLPWLTNILEKSKTVIVKSQNNFKVLKNKTIIDLEAIFNE